MQKFNPEELKKLYVPPSGSHKGQNGKLMIIGGSHLFHASSLWGLQIASRIVDMVFYSSVAENNQIVYELKKEFHNGIIVQRKDVEGYITEADVILIGPGMVRTEKNLTGTQRVLTLDEINALEDEGEQTYFLTKYLLEKYPHKKWIIDAGALQMMEPEWLLKLHGNAIVTPHVQEFGRVFGAPNDTISDDHVAAIAKKYQCVIVLKGEEDTVCSPEQCVSIAGGNAGMTKGGTGDVLAGLIAALACKNELFLSATAGSYINKKAGESLYDRVGYYFNASDLADEIPKVMKDVQKLS